MKKLVTSVSVGAIATIGAATVQAAQYAPGLSSMDASKAWSVSATLRGFYDDNYTTAHSKALGKHDSFGFSVQPQVAINLPMDQTYFGVRYIYGFYYYQRREELNQKAYDQTHQFDLWLDHTFSERWQVKVQDSFVVAQEPALIDPSSSLPTRANGNNIRNVGSVILDTMWTELFSSEVGYQNSFYDYQNHGGTAAAPSLSGLLDRMEHLAWISFGWQVKPTTKVSFGYKYGEVDYDGNEVIAATAPPLPPVTYTSRSRDNRSHYGFLGLQHDFLENLTLNASAGVQYTEYYNDPLNSRSDFAPYADLSLTYTYAQGSSITAGFTQSRNATDVVALDSSGRITEDTESSAFYLSWLQQITPKLSVNAQGRIIYSQFHEGAYNNNADVYYNLGTGLTYHFTPHFSADANYYFDYLASDIPNRSYARNRVYLGVTAAF